MSSSTANLVAGSLVSLNAAAAQQKEVKKPAKPKKLAQYLAAISATLGAFALGNSIGWSSPASRRLQGDFSEVDFEVSPSDFAWVGSLLTVGAALSTFPAGFLVDWIGRKSTMFYITIPYIAGWVIITLANGVEMLYIGRIVTGFCGGVFSVACPMYIGEIADKEVRGTLGACFQLMLVTGIEFTYVVGAFLPYLVLNLMCTAVPVVFAFLFFWMPETPQYLLKRGRRDEARRALQWLRGVEVSGAAGDATNGKADLKELRVDSPMGVVSDKGTGGVLGASEDFNAGGKFDSDANGASSAAGAASHFAFGAGAEIDMELQYMQESVEWLQHDPVPLLKTFTSTAAKRALLISAGLMATQQLSGINAVIFYTEDLFKAAATALESRFSVMVAGAVQVVATFGSVLVIDRLGRRPLMMISNSAMAFCTLLLGFYFFYKERDAASVEGLNWLPILIVCTYFVSFAMGAGPIPWLMVGEIFPPDIKGTAAGLSSCINWLLAFIVTRFYGNLVYVVNVSTSFWIFTVLLLLGLIFVVFALPETRRKSPHDIQIGLGAEPETPMSPMTPMSPADGNNPNPTVPSGSHRHHYHHHRHHHHHRSHSHHSTSSATITTVTTITPKTPKPQD